MTVFNRSEIFIIYTVKGFTINIYVANIAHSVTEDMLKALFQEYGQVRSVKIIKDQLTGEPRGFAFVEMSVVSEGQAAIAGLNEHELEGKKLSVNKAREREAGSRPPRSNGDRGGFGSSNGNRRDDRSRSRY